MSNTDVIERDRGGRFLSGGKPGPGRPKGSRNRLTEDFLRAMADDFAEHGAAAIERTRIEKPDVYVRICADLLPRDIRLDAHIGVDVAVDPGSFADRFRQAMALVGNEPLEPVKVIDARPRDCKTVPVARG